MYAIVQTEAAIDITSLIPWKETASIDPIVPKPSLFSSGFITQIVKRELLKHPKKKKKQKPLAKNQ